MLTHYSLSITLKSGVKNYHEKINDLIVFIFCHIFQTLRNTPRWRTLRVSFIGYTWFDLVKKRDVGECFQRMLSERLPNVRRIRVYQRMQRECECNANDRRVLSDCSPSISLAFAFHLQISFRLMRSANALRMFNELIATTNSHMHISFRRL